MEGRTPPAAPAGGPVLGRAVRAAAPLYAGFVVTAGAAFALKALLVAWVFAGPVDMARFETLDRALQGVVTVALLGMPAALLRLGPERPGELARLARTAALLALAAGGAVCAAVVIVQPLHDLIVGTTSRRWFAVYAVRGAGLAVVAVGGALLHARGQLGRRAVLDGADRVLALAFIGALALAGPFSGLWDAIAGSVSASLAAALLVVPLVRGGGASPSSVAETFAGRASELTSVGRAQLALSLCEAARPLVLLRMAREVSDGRETGLLATAMAFSLPLIFVPEMAAQALAPRMRGPEGEGAHVEGERRSLWREMLVAGVPLLALYGLAAAWLLPMAKDGLYAGAVLPLVLLLPGVLAHGLTAHAGYVLLARDRLRPAVFASALAAVVTAVLAAWLIPSWGAAGGAAALSAALAVRAVLFGAAARGRSGGR